MNNRLNDLRACFDSWGVDAVLITSPTNRRWLSGFTGSAGSLLITPDSAILSTDSRYWEQAVAQAPAFDLYRSKRDPGDTEAFLALAGTPRIGFESRHMTVAEYESMRKIESIDWRPLAETAELLRQRKSAEELALIERAAALTDRAVALVPEIARPGMTEKALSWELEKFFREAGADGPAFEIIVASGPNSARPHHRPTDRALEAGDALTIDLGAQVDGYKSDLTRTYFLGAEPDERFWTVYSTVLAAQEAALGGIRGGVEGKAVDALARDLIAAAGYGENFGHGLGHAVGLDIHESPGFSRVTLGTIPVGAVMTVEPGIYLPGWGGVRIEDLVVVTEEGARLLSHASKDPVIRL